MKRKIVILVLFLFAGFAFVNAQGGGGGFQRRTVEERVKMVHSKIDSAFKLEATNMAAVDSIFANYYRSQDKVREDMMAGGQVDRQAMMEKMQPLMDDRDAKLKKALGDDKFKVWKEQIEPTMRRPGGGGGRGGNNR